MGNRHVFPELYLVYITLFVLTFQHLTKLTGTLFEKSEVLTVGKVMIILTLAVWFFRFSLERDPEPVRSLLQNRTSILMIAYGWVLLLGIIPARSIEACFVVIVQRYSLIILYFILFNALCTIESFKKCILMLLFGSLFAASAGIYEMMTGTAIVENVYDRTGLIVTDEGSHRIQAFAGDPDMHAVFLISMSGLLLYMIYMSRSRIKQVCWIGLLIMFIINILGTGSRAGWLGMLITSIVFLFFIRIRFKFIIGAAFLGVFAVILIVIECADLAPIMERVSSSKKSGDKSTEWRIGWATMSAAMFLDHPLLGIGTGNYYTEYSRYLREAPTSASYINKKPNHNAYLQTLAENGIIGCFIFLTLLISILADISFVLMRGPPEMKYLGTGILASYIGFLYCMSAYPAVGDEFGWIIIAFGCCLSELVRNSTDNKADHISMPVKETQR
ncbi:MAG: O-antigen ligase family protein [Thermodesulfobacteriota bacterium]|nr:O-antigen ligase family protein [Thermodesulfobacteriota bacterium]